jgi:hypothetical protein
MQRQTVVIEQSPAQGQGRARRVLIALSLAILIGLIGVYVLTITSGAFAPRRADFITYYSAGQMVAAGNGGRIYDFQALAAVERVVVRPYTLHYGVLPFVYPPFFAAAVSPLSHAPYEWAYGIWLTLSVASVGMALWVLQRIAGLRGVSALAFWLAAATSLPVFVGLAQGQVSALLLGILALTFLAYRYGYDELAGVALALTLIKPPFAIPFLIIFLVARRWRALAGFGCAAALLFALPSLMLGPSVNAGYLHVVSLAGTWRHAFGYDPSLSNSFSGVCQLLLPSPLSTLVMMLLDAAALAGLAWFAARTGDVDLHVALAVVVGLLISPHVLVHDLTLLVIPVGVALALRHTSSRIVPGLIIGYGLTLLGLGVGAAIHVQVAVISMLVLGGWLMRAGGIMVVASEDSALVPSVESIGHAG